MKKAIIILLLALSISSSAQNWKKGIAIASYHIGTVALGAVADGLYDDGYKHWSHALHAAELGMAIAGPTLVFDIDRSDALSYVLSYGFIRLSTFDSFYNVTRDLPFLYTGSTSKYDEIMSKMPPHGRVWLKSWSIIVGFSIPICEIH